MLTMPALAGYGNDWYGCLRSCSPETKDFCTANQVGGTCRLWPYNLCAFGAIAEKVVRECFKGLVIRVG